MLSTEECEQIICDYKKTYLFCPKTSWAENEFKNRSYERAAINLLLQEIKNNQSNDVKWVISTFSSKMDSLYEQNYDKKIGGMFLIARELSREIYYLFC